MKVMILYANAGNGHRRAAEALAAVCEKDARISEVALVDALQFTNKIFQELYANLYIKMVKKAPALWSLAFDETDEPWEREQGRMLLHRMNAQPLVKELRRFEPDLCLCTHFMPADIISTLLRKESLQTNLCVVVTDYYVHATWLESYVHRMYVAKEESREQLIQLGFPKTHVANLGIPIDPVFNEAADLERLRAKHGLAPDRPLVLLSAGAFGVMSSKDMAHILSSIQTPCQLAVVCGNNAKLKMQVGNYIDQHPSTHISYHLLGFTLEMHEWMKMADLFVGKPGGLSSSECLACGLPLVIWNATPGQEDFNASYLLENGAAIAPDSILTLPFRIDLLLKERTSLRNMSAASKSIGRPNAAQNIINDAIKHIHSGVIKVSPNKSSFWSRLRESS